MAQYAQADESTNIDDLPPEVLDALPADIKEEILSGARDKIPDEVIADLRPDVADQVPDSLVDAASMSPGLTAMVVLIGLAAIAGAIYGAIKGFLKVAIVLSVIAAGVWWYFLSGR